MLIASISSKFAPILCCIVCAIFFNAMIISTVSFPVLLKGSVFLTRTGRNSPDTLDLSP